MTTMDSAKDALMYFPNNYPPKYFIIFSILDFLS